jgi:hypothetical protein
MLTFPEDRRDSRVFSDGALDHLESSRKLAQNHLLSPLCLNKRVRVESVLKASNMRKSERGEAPDILRPPSCCDDQVLEGVVRCLLCVLLPLMPDAVARVQELMLACRHR